MTYPESFKPAATVDLVRIGSAADGGYVIPERVIAASRGLLSFGLCDDWTFEKDFLSRNPVRLVAFDHSVNRGFWVRRILANVLVGLSSLDLRRMLRSLRILDYFRFFRGDDRCHIRKAIGYSTPFSLDLEGALAESGLEEPIFLKMDIEGWEYRILEQLAQNAHRFSGMAIEFHDIDMHREKIERFIAEIADSMMLVHLHPNNYGSLGPDGESLVVEMTFLSKTLILPEEDLSPRPLPLNGLDAPNNATQPESLIVFG